nr:hypothetical protein [Tanacetum cinerariifolium]
MNGKKPLTLDSKTFTTSTGLDYNTGEYVSYTSLKVVKKMIAYCLMTGIKVNIREIIFSDLVTKFTSKSRPTEDSKESHSVSLGNVPDLQDPERNKQLAGMGLPSTQLDEGTRKSQLLPKGTNINLKDSGRNVKPTNKGFPSIVFNEGTVKTTPLPKGPHGDKDSEGFKPPADIDKLIEESEDEVFELEMKWLKKSIILLKKKLRKHMEITASYSDLKSEIEGFYDAAYKVYKDTEAAFSTYEKLLVKFQAQYGEDAKNIL